MKTLKKIINTISFDWKNDYLSRSENLSDLERRLKYVQESEQRLAEIKLKAFGM